MQKALRTLETKQEWEETTQRNLAARKRRLGRRQQELELLKVKQIAQLNASATVIQAMARRRFARGLVARLRERRDAATKIQCAARTRQARKRFRVNHGIVLSCVACCVSQA